MSAIRSNSNRGEARKKRAAPYARGLFGTFARFFGFGEGEGDEESVESSGNTPNGRATGSLNGRPHGTQDPKSQFTSGNRSPLTPLKAGNGLTYAPPEASSSALPNAEQVANYFSQRVGANVTTNEVESMVTDLQTTPEHERFRFTFTTPGRETSPAYSSPTLNATTSPSASPRKKLTKNPNGVYRWEGAGSAKPGRQRNRFGSPAFGASPSKAERANNQSAAQGDPPSSDNKRRKVGQDASTSVASGSGPSVPFPHTSPTTPRSNGIVRQTSPMSSRLRTPAKPTVPVNPSPLRQAWSDASSSSSREDNRTSPSQQQPAKQTSTASKLAELIKETAPANKPDLSNPYQTASPVGKVGPPRRANKRPRATGRPVAPTKEQKEEEEKKKAEEAKQKEAEQKMKTLSSQAIIEATVPKGSKRSRPPAHFDTKPAVESSRASPPPQPVVPTVAEKAAYVVEEVDDDDEEAKRSAKRSKPSVLGRGLPSTLTKAAPIDITVEEIDEVETQPSEKGKEKVTEPPRPAISTSNTTSSSRTPSFTAFKPTSIPREPSKLRFSFQAEASSSTPPPTTEALAPEPVLMTKPVPSPPSIQAVASGYDFTFKPKTTSTPPVSASEPKTQDFAQDHKPLPTADSVKVRVRAMNIKSLPSFVLSTATTAHPSSPEHMKAREAAKAVPTSSLPQFDLGSGKSFSFGFDPAKSKPIPAPSTSTLPTKASPSTFNLFAGAIASSSTPSITNFGASTSKPAPAPVKGFDFAAAGLKLPSSKDTWTCGLCSLSSPQSAIKCTTCDEPRPGASAPKPVAAPSSLFGAPSAAPKPFDWGAAGMKPPASGTDSWNCGLCGLSNPKAAAKCTTCEEPAPSVASTGGSSSMSSAASFLVGGGFSASKGFTPSVGGFGAPKTVEAPVVKGFDFAAAGLKPPTIPKGTWNCSLCGLSNPGAASACKTCENPK